MGKKYVIFLLGFDVVLRDRRNGEEANGFIVVPFPEEHPDDLEDAYKGIRDHYGRLGYDVEEIRHQESKAKEIDLLGAYKIAPAAAEYAQ